jgi:LysR family transcriptional regulator, hydrogen peroxide-inducible genes activator
MEMHQIRYFLALSEELNFTRAARRCGVTQPSLTNAIRALEKELRGAVFNRKPRIELTELGRAIRPFLQEIAQHANWVRETASMMASEPAPVPSPPFHGAANGSSMEVLRKPVPWTASERTRGGQ